jgi:hypothetical protein
MLAANTQASNGPVECIIDVSYFPFPVRPSCLIDKRGLTLCRSLWGAVFLRRASGIIFWLGRVDILDGGMELFISPQRSSTVHPP